MLETQNLEYVQNKLSDNITALILTDVDMHQSEIPAKHFRPRSWLSGFTGSAGTLVLTAKAAALWTDSRYFVQAKQVLQDKAIRPYLSTEHFDASLLDWVRKQVPAGSTIAVYYPSVHTMEKWQENLPDYTFIEAAPFIDEHWSDRPVHKHSKAFSYAQYHQKPRKEKLDWLRHEIKEKKCSHHLISTLDDVAWVLNLRATDLEHTPVFYAHLLVNTVSSKEIATLFVAPESITPEIKEELQADGISIQPYTDILKVLHGIAVEEPCLIDPVRIPFFLYKGISSKTVLAEQPTIMGKAVKSTEEVNAMQSIYRKEGLVLVKLLHWIFSNAAAGNALEEGKIDKQLQALRRQHKEYVSDSFATIVAFKAHAALPHYNFRVERNTSIDGDGLLLIDTGGHYLGGSTDTTRCIYLGSHVPADVARDYTLVLKANIALSRSCFPKDASGIHLDAITRYQLWQEGMNYGHSTGHGIGNLLEVHEAPPFISPRAPQIPVSNMLKPGMIVSNEPGLYREGDYGIRIENVLSVKEHCSNEFGTFYAFDTLTLCPFDRRLIVSSLCTAEELDWVDSYHNHVFLELADLVNTEEYAYLVEATKALPR